MPVLTFTSGDQMIVGDDVVFLEEFADALIGVGHHYTPRGILSVAVYDKQKSIQILSKRSLEYCTKLDCAEVCDHWEDAMEHFQFNVENLYKPEIARGCMPVFVDVLEDA